jgi:hypothetical protein
MLVSFRIGRGGRYGNGGHKSFDRCGKNICEYMDDLYIRDEDWVAEAATETPESEWVEAYRGGDLPTTEMGVYNDAGNRVMDWSDYCRARETGVGVLDLDEYDKVIVRLATELNEAELQIIAADAPREMPDVLRAWDSGDGEVDETTLSVVAYHSDWEGYLNYLFGGQGGDRYLAHYYEAHDEEPDGKAAHVGGKWWVAA